MPSINDLSERSYAYMSTLGFRIAISTLAHPCDYAKFLIQIGHEPLPPYNTRTLFGKPARALPNIFKYVNYIRNTDGILGCYRGFGPKITGQIISTLVAESVSKKIKVIDGFDPHEDEVSSGERWLHFRQTLTKDIVNRSVTIVISQPFYVVSARMMAQFVGGEEIYSGFFASIKEIYSNDGLSGLFTGFVPRWLGEMTALILSSFAIYGFNNYIIEDKDLKGFSSAIINFLSHTLTYPFSVVSACMAVNNCKLAAGLPPNMPIFDNWTHCWRYLHQIGQLNRGSSTIYRYCPPTFKKIGPYTWVQKVQ